MSKQKDMQETERPRGGGRPREAGLGGGASVDGYEVVAARRHAFADQRFSTGQVHEERSWLMRADQVAIGTLEG